MPVNYPDVLRYVTNGLDPYTVGPVQFAMTTRPRIVQSGRPIEIVLLVQNTIDADVEVTATLHKPEKDASGDKGRFLTGTDRLVIDLKAAEVGFVKLPITTMPDVAPSKEYLVWMDIAVKMGKKGETIRTTEGAEAVSFDPSRLPRSQQEHIADLKRRSFYVDERSGFLKSKGLQVRFAVKPGKGGKPLNLKPGWVSLWTLADQDDINVMFSNYQEALRLRVVPTLTRDTYLKPLQYQTATHFEKAGYSLHDIEIDAIAKLMTLILEYGNAGHTGHSPIEAGAYNLLPYIRQGYTPPADKPMTLPHWLARYLRVVTNDERALKVPERAIPLTAYNALLRDALLFGFDVIENATGENLGTAEEKAGYADAFEEKFKQKRALDFSYVYVPLVLAGIIIYDRVLMPEERLGDVLDQMKQMLDARENEFTEENEAIFKLADRIVTQALRKYGSLDSRDR